METDWIAVPVDPENLLTRADFVVMSFSSNFSQRRKQRDIGEGEGSFHFLECHRSENHNEQSRAINVYRCA
jgi:hypothetical protein